MARKRDADKERVLKEARTRFKLCENWESTARPRYVDDVKFCEGDSDNLYQWPEDIRSRMEDDKRAMLTINKTRQHCLDVLNDARQAKVAIKIRPTGGGASFDSAQVYEGVIRHIEYISNASAAYQHGLKCAVQGGIGYWRVVTAYANDDSFDQEVFIRRIFDPLSVYIDPFINEFDGSDARYAFVYSETAKDQFDAENPSFKGRVYNENLGPGVTWVKEDSVRVAEYFRRVDHTEKLLAYLDHPEDPDSIKVVRESDLSPELVKMWLAIPTTKVRTIKGHKVEWYKIMGDEIVDQRDWPGTYIPIVRCVGEETVIDGEMDRKGHVRALKDAQRLFNYNSSGSVEFGALQSKSPYIAPADAMEGYEDYWNNLNTENFPVLPYNHKDDEGGDIPAPRRQEPPMGAPVFMQGMKDAAEWMRMVSGQYQADMGAPSNERSGAAITARQRQGDNATFHYLDHQSIAIRFTGKILIDLIPKVYDTPRVMKILAENGDQMQIRLDPDAPDALKQLSKERDEVSAIFNPSVGKYEVQADVGPAYQTMRQEAWNAYVQIISQNKDLTALIGDLAFRMADFPGAEEIAQRLKRMVPAQALQDGPTPDMIKAGQQIQAMQQMIAQLAAKLADKTADHANDQEKNAISGYDAQTKRIAAIKDYLAADPEGLAELVRQVILEAEATSRPALMPTVTPTPPITGPMVAPQPQGAPPGPTEAPTGGLPANLNPDDMGAGPPAALSGGPV